MQIDTKAPTLRAGRGVLKWIGRIAGAILALLLVAATIAGMREFFVERNDRARFPLQGRRVDIGGYSLNLNCKGEGSPTVILESGWSVPGVSWSLVQPEIARFARVCSYDRAGYGWSDEGPMPRTADEIARELHALLHNAGITPPYILAGHSLGGYVIRCFRGMYPAEVVGMVLVDPSQEDMNALTPVDLTEAYREQVNQIKKFDRFIPLLVRLGLVRKMVREQQEDYKLTPELLEEVVYLSSQPKALRAMVSEMDAVLDDNEDAKEVRTYGSAPGSFGALPLIVVSARYTLQGTSVEGINGFLRTVVTDLHPRIVRLSTKGKQTIVDGSHFIPFENPHVVIAAIREVRDAATAEHSDK